MRPNYRLRAGRIAATLALAWILVSPAHVYTKPLGKGSDPMLAALEAPLDALGIDIVPGLARSLDFKPAPSFLPNGPQCRRSDVCSWPLRGMMSKPPSA
jgi:hypothetical protein